MAFGRASMKVENTSGGSGIRFIADITRVVAEQLLADSVEDLTLRIDVVPQQRLPDEARIVIGYIGVFIQSSTA